MATGSDNMAQEVRITLDDGRVLKYTGPAQVREGEMALLKIVEVEFSRPYPLPGGMTWGSVPLHHDPVSQDHGTGLHSDA
jgi:hypothetical protein